jgi:uncharacterized protein YnzC (UPF0291/DUF896 family)
MKQHYRWGEQRKEFEDWKKKNHSKHKKMTVEERDEFNKWRRYYAEKIKHLTR